MTEYVVGFAFSHSNYVLLIEKQRPCWQKGRLNGIGGHVEAGELPSQAMAREFKEETNIWVPPDAWYHYATLKCADEQTIFFFWVVLTDLFLNQRCQLTDEKLFLMPWWEVTPHNAIPNLTWMLPMAGNLSLEISPRKAKRLILTEVY